MPSFRERAKGLREEAGKSAKAAEAILNYAADEKRALTADEEALVDKLQDDAEKGVERAVTLERQASLNAGFETEDSGSGLGRGEEIDEGAGEGRAATPARPGRYGDIENGLMRHARGLGRLENLTDGFSQFLNCCGSADYRKNFLAYLAGGGQGVSRQIRSALQIDVETGAGYVVVSDRFVDKIVQAAKDQMPLLDLIFSIPALYGENLGAVSVDATVGAFTMAGELTAATEDTNVQFGRRQLSPHAVGRKTIKVSNALLRMPTRIDIEAFLAGEVAYRYATLQEDKVCNGSGANEPLGLFVASAQGISTSRDVSTDNAATAVTADNAIEVQETLKPAYQANARWLGHRDYFKRLRKLKDGEGQFLWQPGLQEGRPNVFLGKQYVASEYAPNTFSTGQYVGIYGDFSHYWLAHVVNFTMQRLVEKYAEDGMTGLLFDNMGIDGMPTLAEAFVRIKMG